ncbi:hypothetical protein ACXR0O_29420 [Verrucomicrobiota bacterium sgz303538]
MGTGPLIFGANGTLITPYLYVGEGKSGYLDVSSGGDITVREQTVIGDDFNGSVTVTGSGSTFTQRGFNAVVGSAYLGSLTVSNDALATFQTGLYIGGLGVRQARSS